MGRLFWSCYFQLTTATFHLFKTQVASIQSHPNQSWAPKFAAWTIMKLWDRKLGEKKGSVFRGVSKGDHEVSMFQYLFKWWGILGMFYWGVWTCFCFSWGERKVFLAFQRGCFFLQEKKRSSSHSYLQTRKLKHLIIQRITHCTRKKLWKGDNQVKLCFKNCMSYS